MLPFEIRGLKVTSLADLSPGAMFFQTDRNGSQHLAVMVVPTQPGFATWIHLSGPEAFRFQTRERPQRQYGLALGIAAERIRLRVDASSVPVDGREHQPGRLIFETEGRACIAAVWPEFEDRNYRNAVDLSDWSCPKVPAPSFMFDRWALSFADETGKWIDLVERDSKVRNAPTVLP